MGSIKQEAQKISHNANEIVRNTTENLKSKFNAVISGLNARYKGVIAGDVVGINTNRIPEMQAAIRSYIDNLQDHLDTVVTNASTENAFKGQYAEAVTEFVTAVKEACKLVIEDLSAFSDELQEVADKYVAKDTDVTSDIRSQAESI